MGISENQDKLVSKLSGMIIVLIDIKKFKIVFFNLIFVLRNGIPIRQI